MKKINPLNIYRVIAYTALAFFFGFFALALVTLFMPTIFGDKTSIYSAVILVISILLLFLFAILFRQVISQKRLLEQLRTENSFVLGQPIAFYNIFAFKNRATVLLRNRRLSSKEKYVIAFSVASIDIASNAFKNDDVTRLNYLVAEFLTNYFGDRKDYYTVKNNIYGFDRGVFLVYTFVDRQDQLTELVKHISQGINDLVAENDIRIWVQPFFGIRQITSDVNNLTVAIEDAMLARSKSEANFEQYTFFNDKYRQETDKGDFNEIEAAFKNGEFIPYYQPKYSLKEKRFVSAEVLARWNSPKYGLITPVKFIDKAERAGLLSAIDVYIFKKALADMGDALKRGRRVIPISCNFSLYEFFSRNYLDMIVESLKQYQVPAKYVEIEITESTSQTNKFLSVSIIKKLRELGIRILMDDFGVGYSQIDNLKNIPFDAIKIDKSFTDEILTDNKSKSIVNFLIQLGHSNNLEVIIEGVENKEQVELLKKLKVDTIQGFYYSKALPLKEYQEFLKENPFEGGAKK